MDLPIEPTRSEPHAEAHVRQLLDRAIGRALVDQTYLGLLLADPGLAIGEVGCTPQQRRALRDIHARGLHELAEQVEAVFWPARQTVAQRRAPLAAAVGM